MKNFKQHIKEEVEQIEEKTTSVNGIPVGAEVASEVENMKKEIRKEQGAWQMDTGWKKIKPQTPDKSGAVHKPTSRAKHLAQKAKEITAKKIKLGMLK